MSTEVGAIHATLAVYSQEWQKGLEQAEKSAKEFEKTSGSLFEQIMREGKAALDGLAREMRNVGAVLQSAGSDFRATGASITGVLERIAAEGREAMGELRQAMDRMAAESRQTADVVQRSMKEVAEALRHTGDGAKHAGHQMMDLKMQLMDAGMVFTAVGAAGTAAVGAAGKAFVEFEGSMRNVNSVTHLSEQAFQGMTEQVLSLANDPRVTQGPRDLAAALYDINSSGFAGADSMTVLREAALSASAGLTTADVAAKGLTGALQAYDAGVDQAARFSDVMFRTVDKGVITFEELSHGLGIVTQSAHASGISFEELNAAIATATVKGVPMGEVFTGLRQAIMHIAAPSREAEKAVASLAAAGIKLQTGEVAIREKGLLGALVDIVEKTGGNKKILQDILGDVNAVNIALALAGDHGKRFAGIFGDMDKSGARAAALAEQAKSVQFQMKQLAAAAEAAAIVFARTFEPAMAAVTQALREGVAWFQQLSPAMQKTIAVMAAVGSGLALVAGSAMLLAPQLMSIVGLWGQFVAWAPRVGAAITTMAGPIGIAIAAVAALGVAWSQNWFHIREATQEVIDWLAPYVQDGLQAVRAAFVRLGQDMRSLMADIGAPVQAGWKDIAASTKAIWEGIEPIVSMALIGLSGIIKATMAVIKFNWDVMWSEIKGIVSIVWPIISGYVTAALALIRGSIEAGMALLHGDWKKAWGAVEKAAGDAWSRLSQGFAAAGENLVQALRNLKNDFFNAGRELIEAFQHGLTDSLSGGQQGGVEETLRDKAIRAHAKFMRDPTKLTQDDWAVLRQTAGTADDPILLATARQGDAYEKNRMRPRPSSTKPPVNAQEQPWSPGPDVGSGPGKKPKRTATRAQSIGEYVRDVQRQSYPGATITDTFSSPRSRTTGPGIHSGDDIGMPRGSRALAAFPGKVENIVPIPEGDGGGMGVWIRMANGWLAKYTHLTGLVVRVGDEIKRSQALGNIYRDHLDFKLQDANGKYLNIDKMKAGPATRGLSDAERIESDKRRSQERFSSFMGRDDDEFTQKRLKLKKWYDEVQVDENLSHTQRLEAQRQYARLSEQIDAEASEASFKSLMAYSQKRTEIDQQGQDLDEKRAEDERAVEEQRVADMDERHQVALDDLDFKRQIGEIDVEQYRARLAGELNSFTEHSDLMRETQLKYSQEFQGYLDEQRELIGEEYVEWLRQQEAAIVAAGDFSTSKQIELNGIRRAIHAEEKKRVEEQRQQLIQAAQSVQGAFEGFLENVLTGQKSFKDAFTGLWQEIKNTVIRYVVQMIMKVLALQKLMQAAFSFLGGLFAPAIGIGGTDILNAGIGVAHTGGRVVPGGIATFHDGGLAGFALKPDEVLAKLQVGEIVLNRRQQGEVAGAIAGGGRGEQPVSITIEHFEAHHTSDVDGLARQLAQRMRYELQGR